MVPAATDIIVGMGAAVLAFVRSVGGGGGGPFWGSPVPGRSAIGGPPMKTSA